MCCHRPWYYDEACTKGHAPLRLIRNLPKTRVGQTPYMHGVCKEFFTGKSPNVRSHTVYIYGSGQPYIPTYVHGPGQPTYSLSIRKHKPKQDASRCAPKQDASRCAPKQDASRGAPKQDASIGAPKQVQADTHLNNMQAESHLEKMQAEVHPNKMQAERCTQVRCKQRHT